MIISHGRKYIFVHIPKTGGTSLSLALEDKAMKDDILIGDTPKATKRRKRIKTLKASGRLWKHSRLSDMYGLVTQDQIQDYFVFTIVRNPWDRIVSYYHWLKAQRFEHPAVTYAKQMSFTEFLTHPAVQQSMANHDAHHYVSDAKGNAQCDLYLRQECLQDDMIALQNHLGLKLAPLNHTNQSNRERDYKSYYTTQTRDVIYKLYADDIEKFHYRF